MEVPDPSVASNKLLSELEACDTELMFGTNESEITDTGDLLGEDFVKSQFVKSEADNYSSWTEEHKSLMEAMELFKTPEGQEKEWSKLTEAPLLDLPQTEQDASPDVLGSGQIISTADLSIPSPKSALAQASQSLPYPSSRVTQPAQMTEVVNQEKSPKRKAAIAGTVRPRKKTKREPIAEKPAAKIASPSPLPQATFSVSSLPNMASTAASLLSSTTPSPSSSSPILLAKNTSTGAKPQTTTHPVGSTVLPNLSIPNPNMQSQATSGLSTSNGVSTEKNVPSDKDVLTETTANQLLDENLHVISVMRENLVNGKVAQNFELMMRFSNNIGLVLKWLQTLSNVQMPPLPVKLNTYFFNTTTTLPPSLLTNPPTHNNNNTTTSSTSIKREGEL